MEEFLQYVNALHPVLIYGILLGIALIENIFPPAPSDLVIVFGGSLVALGQTGFTETLLSATAGSTIGFVIMFKLGEWFGTSVIEQGRMPFIKRTAVHKAQSWFTRYGYWLIVANRFLSGTRAVISFVAGLSHLTLWRTTVLCFLSALLWNGVLVLAGFLLGHNWERIGFYLTTYSQVVIAVLIIVALVIGGHRVYHRRRKKKLGRIHD